MTVSFQVLQYNKFCCCRWCVNLPSGSLKRNLVTCLWQELVLGWVPFRQIVVNKIDLQTVIMVASSSGCLTVSWNVKKRCEPIKMLFCWQISRIRWTKARGNLQENRIKEAHIYNQKHSKGKKAWRIQDSGGHTECNIQRNKQRVTDLTRQCEMTTKRELRIVVSSQKIFRARWSLMRDEIAHILKHVVHKKEGCHSIVAFAALN